MKNKTRDGRTPEPAATPDEGFADLKSYITDKTHRCLAEYENIRKICEDYSFSRYPILMTDLQIKPDLARVDDSTVIPTLVRMPGIPGRRIRGMFTGIKKVIQARDLPVGSGDYQKGCHMTMKAKNTW